MKRELWLPVKNLPGYEVSSVGRVRSVARRIERSTTPMSVRGKVLKVRKHKHGYLMIKLLGKMYLVHRLVMASFRRSSKSRTQVNHKNGDKTDNRLENLEYVTSYENMRHAFASGLNQGASGENHPSAKLTTAQVLRIRRDLQLGLTEAQLAKKFRVSRSTVSAIKHRRIWSHV